MSELLDRAIVEVSRLPEDEQDAIGAWLLEELKSEASWAKSFSRSHDQLSSLATEALAEHKAGRTLPLDP